MDEFIKIITDWREIVKALFLAFIVWVIPKIYNISIELSSKQSRKVKISYLISRFYKYNAILGKNYSDDATFITILIFRAFPSLLKAFIWLILGLLMTLIFESGKSVFLFAGYFGCLYYLFSALLMIMPIIPRPTPNDAKNEIKKIKEEAKKYPELEGFSELD